MDACGFEQSPVKADKLAKQSLLDIVVLLVEDWEMFHRRPMLEAFAKNAEGHARILYLNAPLCSPAAVFFRLERFRRWRRDPGVRQLSPNTYLYTPTTWLPLRLSSRLGLWEIQKAVLTRKVRNVLSGLRFDSPRRVLWVFRPEQVRWLGLAGEDHILYECYDEYAVSSLTGERLPEAEENERQLLSRASVVFATSKPLWESRARRHPRAFFVPNGANFALFSKVWREDVPIPAELAAIRKPIIGYAGNVSLFMELSLISHAARARPDWSFVLLGKLAPGLPKDELEELRACPNVYLLGRKPYADVPAFTKGFDVSIMPLRLNRYLDVSEPLTVWEQLAAGRVMVTTNVKELSKLGDILFVAKDKDDFVRCIERAVTEDNRGRIERGTAAAKERSWDSITRRALDILLQEMPG